MIPPCHGKRYHLQIRKVCDRTFHKFGRLGIVIVQGPSTIVHVKKDGLVLDGIGKKRVFFDQKVLQRRCGRMTEEALGRKVRIAACELHVPVPTEGDALCQGHIRLHFKGENGRMLMHGKAFQKNFSEGRLVASMSIQRQHVRLLKLLLLPSNQLSHHLLGTLKGVFVLHVILIFLIVKVTGVHQGGLPVYRRLVQHQR